MLLRTSSPGASSSAVHSVDGSGSGASSTARRRNGTTGSVDHSPSSSVVSGSAAGCGALKPPLASRNVPPAVVCSSGSSCCLPRPKNPRFSSFFGAENGSDRGAGLSRLLWTRSRSSRFFSSWRSHAPPGRLKYQPSGSAEGFSSASSGRLSPLSIVMRVT